MDPFCRGPKCCFTLPSRSLTRPLCPGEQRTRRQRDRERERERNTFPPQDSGIDCWVRHHRIPLHASIEDVAVFPPGHMAVQRPYLRQDKGRPSFYLAPMDAHPRHVETSLMPLQPGLGLSPSLLRHPRTCKVCRVFAHFKTYSVQGQVWQPQRAACRTRMTWFCNRCFNMLQRGVGKENPPVSPKRPVSPASAFLRSTLPAPHERREGSPTPG